MKVTAISDLHGNLIDIEPCDLLLICGDISPLEIQRDYIQMTKWIFNEFQEWIMKIDCPTIILTPGNHDFWGFNIEDLYKWFDDHNINYLAPEKPYVKDGITFVGGTLFSNFRSNTLDPWDVDKSKIHCGVFKDFRKIYIDNTLVNPSNYITEFNKCWNYG